MKFTLGLLYVDLFPPRLISFQPSACKHRIICLLGWSVESNKGCSLTKPVSEHDDAFGKVHLYSKSWEEMILERKKTFRIMQRMKFTQLLKLRWERLCMQLCLFNWLGLSFSTQNRYILHKNGIYWFIISYMSLVSSVKCCLLHFKFIIEFTAPLCFF